MKTKENLVKNLRTELNLSQNDLAVKVGVTPKYIGFIENGERNPSLLVAKRISEALGKSIDEIFFDLNMYETYT